MIDPKRFIYAIAAVSAAAMLAACDPVNPEPGPEPEPEPEPVTKTLSFVLPSNAGAGKTAWVAGDKIVVHGEYAAQQVIVTLEAGDINGKTATKTVENLFPYVREDCASTLYAAYPADLVDNLTHCFFYSKFNTTNTELLAACNDSNDSFNFQPVCSMLSFNSGEAYESFVITANKKESLGYEFMQVKLTDKEQNYNQYRGAPILELDVKSGTSKNTVFIPAGTSVAGGITIKFRKNGEVVKAYTNAEPIEFERGKVVDLGDISKEMKDYVNPFSPDIKDLDSKGNANCYIVSAPGKYKFKAVKGNNAAEFVPDVATADVLWETWNNGEEVTAGSVVASAMFAEDYIIIAMPATLHPGNAVVAARDENGVIKWSWHIWVPQTEIVTKNYGILAPDMMDRNLGALVAATADAPTPVESFGLSYQWGRKDPFPNAKEAKSSSNATVAGVEVTQMDGSGSGDESKITLEQSIANPTLLGFAQNGDWLTPQTNDLWMDSEKTIYDPCPPGYRVPARDKSQPFHSSDLSAAAGWSESTTNFVFTIGNPVAVFPLAGYRDDYGPGGFTHAYDRGAYWTAYASADGKTGYYVNVRSPGSAHKLTEVGKARGCSVRCVVE